ASRKGRDVADEAVLRDIATKMSALPPP
ncbi:ATP phosphoribosyltransferase catalytic subunit HisG, partial [Mesorhizobium sp. M1D.F.Ca.ET.183.01.1.1]